MRFSHRASTGWCVPHNSTFFIGSPVRERRLTMHPLKKAFSSVEDGHQVSSELTSIGCIASANALPIWPKIFAEPK